MPQPRTWQPISGRSESLEPVYRQAEGESAIERLEPRVLLHGADPLHPPAGGLFNEDPVAVANASPTQGNLPLTVTFDAADSSDNVDTDLKFLWNFGDGAPRRRGPVVRHTYEVRGQYFARLTVFDGHGGKDADFVRILAGESIPNAVIYFPGEGELYQAGASFTFFGRATDSQDGPLPDGALTWTITLHANSRSTVLGQFRGISSGSFRVPATLPGDPNQFIRLTLSAEDSAGIVGRSRVNLTPQLSDLTLNTTFPGLTVRFDNRPVVSGRTFPSVVGSTHTVSAARFQQIGNTVYEFVSWSDGGDATHDINVPFAGTTLTAVYRISQVITNSFGAKSLFSTRRI